MKASKIIGHYSALISIFLLLIIEGDHFGGFYLLYLLLALPHGASYALTAVTGIGLLICAYKLTSGKWRISLSLTGFLLLFLSLYIFFGRGDNKSGTFHETVPLISFILFGISAICFLVNTANDYLNISGRKHVNSIIA